MKRKLLTLLAALGTLAGPLAPAAEAARVVVRGPRTKVVVRTGFPIVRPLPNVVVRPARVTVRVAPVTYLAAVPFAPVVIAAPPRDVLVWEDSERLDRDDDWTDFSLSVDSRGTALFLEVHGRVQVNFAEVVFENGQAQVVDFGEKPLKKGLYSLLDFRDGRKVDHVRLIARARSEDARVTVRMQK